MTQMWQLVSKALPVIFRRFDAKAVAGNRTPWDEMLTIEEAKSKQAHYSALTAGLSRFASAIGS
eukprot:10398254-Alexandrium_andersonii.AAC.1